MLRICYLNKPDNLPHYRKGKELHLVHEDIGWVEHLSQHMDIFWIEGLTQSSFDSWKEVSFGKCRDQYCSQDFVSLGLLKNLVEYKTEHEFDLPLFASFDNDKFIVTCGMSRFFALAACQSRPEDIKFFLQAKKGSTFTGVLKQQLITSTAQAEQVSGIGDVNHILTMDTTYPHYVISSVLRESIYNKIIHSEQLMFADSGKSIMNFWNRFVYDKLINIEVHCTESTRPLIQFSPSVWRVNYHVGHMPPFAYSDILDNFEAQIDRKLHLNVYNITEPLHLEFMLPLVSKDNSWFHTQNKKVHLYETTQTTNGASQPIVPWPNFVK